MPTINGLIFCPSAALKDMLSQTIHDVQTVVRIVVNFNPASLALLATLCPSAYKGKNAG